MISFQPCLQRAAVLLAAAAGLAVAPAGAQPFVPGQTYFGRSNYIEYIAGDLPIILSAPHGGSLMPGEIPNRTNCTTCGWDFSTATDSNTEDLARKIRTEIQNLTGFVPHVTICRLDRDKIDCNREIVEGAQGNVYAMQAWNEFQDFIIASKTNAVARHGKGFYMDLHGHGHAIQRLELGYLLTSTQLGYSDATLNSTTYENLSSIRTLSQQSPLSFPALLRGSTSFGALISAEGYPAVPSPDIPNPGSDPYFNGGYNTVQHGSRYGGLIDGLQIEHNMTGVRDSSANRTAYAQALARVLETYFALHYNINLRSCALKIWSGGGGNWNSTGSWHNGALPVSSNNIVFAGAGGTSSHNLAALATGNGVIGSITFSNAASGSYTLSGNAFTLIGGITNNSALAHTISNHITLSGARTIAASSNSLTFGGNVTNGGSLLTFAGNGNCTASGVISGSGGLTKVGAGALTLSGANTFSGKTTVGGGTLSLSAESALGATPGSTVTDHLTLDGGTLQSTASLTLSANRGVSLGAGGGILEPTTGALTCAAVIGGAGALTKKGAGTLALTAVNTYSGDTTNLAGVISLNATATFGNGTGLLALAGGDILSANTRSGAPIANPILMTANTAIYGNGTLTNSTRVFPLSASSITTVAGTLTVRNAGTNPNATNNVFRLRLTGGGFNFTQPLLIGHPADLSSTVSQVESYNDNASGDQIFSGLISGSGQFRRDAAGGAAGGTTVLSAENTYSGGTTLNNGWLGLGSSSTLSNSAVVSGPLGTGTLTINNGPVAGLFAFGGPRTVANRIVLDGVTNTQFIGANGLTLAGTINVGTTVEKVLTVNNAGLTTFSGTLTNSAPITKAGSGTLVLEGNNTYSGQTTVNAGTLLVNNSSGSGTGLGSVLVNANGTLSGNGAIAGTVSGSGQVSPGASAGTLTLGNGLDLSSGGTYVWELFALSTNNPGADFDQLVLTGGTLKLDGNSKVLLSFVGAATPPETTHSFWQAPRAWKVLALTGGATNPGASRFTTVLNGAFAAGHFTNTVDGAGNVWLQFVPVPPPPPPLLSPLIPGAGTPAATLTWSAVSGQTYQVQYKDDLNASNWQLLGAVMATSSSASLTDSNAAVPQRFYRVVIP